MQVRQANDGRTRRVTSMRRAVAAKRQRLHERCVRLEAGAAPDGVFAAGLQAGMAQRAAFPEAMHGWHEVHGCLVTRRHQLVISAGKHFQLEPKVCARRNFTRGARWTALCHFMQQRRVPTACVPPLPYTVTIFVQAVVRHQGGVLTAMQELWMRAPYLNSNGAEHALARTHSVARSTASHARTSRAGSAMTLSAPGGVADAAAVIALLDSPGGTLLHVCFMAIAHAHGPGAP
jgi:hypothetical protein